MFLLTFSFESQIVNLFLFVRRFEPHCSYFKNLFSIKKSVVILQAILYRPLQLFLWFGCSLVSYGKIKYIIKNGSSLCILDVFSTAWTFAGLIPVFTMIKAKSLIRSRWMHVGLIKQVWLLFHFCFFYVIVVNSGVKVYFSLLFWLTIFVFFGNSQNLLSL